MWGIFFGEFQCLPVDDCPAACCDSDVLTRGSESTSFYSAILVPTASSRSFIVSGLTFRSLIHLELIFVCDVKELSHFIFLHVAVQFS